MNRQETAQKLRAEKSVGYRLRHVQQLLFGKEYKTYYCVDWCRHKHMQKVWCCNYTYKMIKMIKY